MNCYGEKKKTMMGMLMEFRLLLFTGVRGCSSLGKKEISEKRKASTAGGTKESRVVPSQRALDFRKAKTNQRIQMKKRLVQSRRTEDI